MRFTGPHLCPALLESVAPSASAEDLPRLFKANPANAAPTMPTPTRMDAEEERGDLILEFFAIRKYRRPPPPAPFSTLTPDERV